MTKRKQLGRKKSGVKKSSLNTTIRTDVLDEFRINCKNIHMNMGDVIEMFMEGFNKKEYKLGIVKSEDVTDSNL